MRKLIIVLALLACATSLLYGQATVGNGTLNLGVNTYGNVFNPSSYIGLQLVANGDDAISPGSPRSGWGIAANGFSGVADPYTTGTYGLTLLTPAFAASPTTIYSVTELKNGGLSPVDLKISQVYTPVPGVPNVYVDKIAITNIGTSTASNVLLSQQTDWDVLPTRFNEYSNISGVGGSVVYNTAYGFNSADPQSPTCFYNCNVPAGLYGPSDLGEGFIKSLGDLDPGKTKLVFMFYGGDTSTAAMQADMVAVRNIYGAFDVMAAMQGVDPATGLPCTSCDTWAFAINENPVPEPGTLLMLGTGLLGVVGAARRKFNL
jgi:hypothetical protein